MADQTGVADGTRRGPDSKQERDALSVALDAVNDRWSLHVVRAVSFGASRFTDILAAVGAPRDVLSARLRKLTAMGVLEPREPEKGRLAGYALTQKGRDLGAVILVLKRWGDTYREDAAVPLDLVHDPCGEILVAEVSCQACGRAVEAEEISYAAGTGSERRRVDRTGG